MSRSAEFVNPEIGLFPMYSVNAFGAADMLLRPVPSLVLSETVRGIKHNVLFAVVNDAVIRSRVVVRQSVSANRYFTRFGLVENKLRISEFFEHLAVNEKFASVSDIDCLAHFIPP